MVLLFYKSDYSYSCDFVLQKVNCPYLGKHLIKSDFIHFMKTEEVCCFFFHKDLFIRQINPHVKQILTHYQLSFNLHCRTQIPYISCKFFLSNSKLNTTKKKSYIFLSVIFRHFSPYSSKLQISTFNTIVIGNGNVISGNIWTAESVKD